MAVLLKFNVPCRFTMIPIHAVTWADDGDKKKWFCSIVRVVSRALRCFMNVRSSAGECVGCARTYYHCPLVVHRFGVESDWMIKKAEWSGRIWSMIYRAGRRPRCTSATSSPEPPASATCGFPISHCFRVTTTSILPLQIQNSAALMPRGRPCLALNAQSGKSLTIARKY